MLDARAGSPPSGGALLVRAAQSHDLEAIRRLLQDLENWSAEVLESHLSFPVLSYYRSQHDNQSWLAALIASLDACALIIAMVKGVRALSSAAHVRHGPACGRRPSAGVSCSGAGRERPSPGARGARTFARRAFEAGSSICTTKPRPSRSSPNCGPCTSRSCWPWAGISSSRSRLLSRDRNGRQLANQRLDAAHRRHRQAASRDGRRTITSLRISGGAASPPAFFVSVIGRNMAGETPAPQTLTRRRSHIGDPNDAKRSLRIINSGRRSLLRRSVRDRVPTPDRHCESC